MRATTPGAPNGAPFVQKGTQREGAQCAICGRRLTNPESRERGYGPVCAGRVGATRSAAPARDVATAELFADQPLEVAGLICVREADGRLRVNVPDKHVHHSPTGFEIAYSGSGPADLALNVLAALLPWNKADDGVQLWDGSIVSRTAWDLHQGFKERFLASMASDGGSVPIQTIREWIARNAVTA